MMTRRLRPLASGCAGTHTRCAASSFHAETLSCEFHAARARKRNTPRTCVLALMIAARVQKFHKHMLQTDYYKYLPKFHFMTVRLE